MADRFERFSLAITEIWRDWHRLAGAEMERYGLKGAHAVYLTSMLARPEGVTAGQLAELCGKDKSDVSRMVGMLEKKGLVRKVSAHQNGYGGALLRRLAQIAVERGCGRLEWSCLDWNQPSIDFYRGLGAVPMEGWTVYRLTGETLRAAAE